MLRITLRVFAILFLLGSVALGVRAAYAWLTPGDEQEFYDQKYRAAMEKVQKAEAARGTSSEARLAQEAKEAIASADMWGRAARDRSRSNLIGVIVTGAVAFFSFIALLLTFIKRKEPAAAAYGNAWSNDNQSLNYGGQPSFDNRQQPRY